tara:strand:+ start:3204 stop:4106 length:903 start_codon:yes stop_codon:yes gene_type:complete
MVDFRLFVQIAESNSLRQGASHVCLSASAASTRIANLEARSATKLLIRSSKGVTLTVAGQAFLYHAKQVLDQIENLNADLEEYAQSMKGHLRLAANPTAIKEYLPATLKLFMSKHPDVRLDLRELFTNEILRSVSAGVSDIGIVIGDRDIEGFDSVPYRDIRLVLIAPHAHPLATRKSVSFKEILKHEFIAFPDGSPAYSPVYNAADEMSVKIRTRARATTFDSMCSLVEAGIGLGVAPEVSARRVAESMEIMVVPISDDSAVLTHHICARRFKSLPSFGKDFVSALLNEDGVKTSIVDF